MRKIDSDVLEWALDVMESAHRSGFGGINAVERILKDPGIQTSGSSHRVLWWPKSRRISRMSKAMHQIDPISQICLIVDAGVLMDDEGRVFGMKDLAKNSTLTVGDARDRAKKAKRSLKFVFSKLASD